jgi:hypothetical protein
MLALGVLAHRLRELRRSFRWENGGWRFERHQFSGGFVDTSLAGGPFSHRALLFVARKLTQADIVRNRADHLSFYPAPHPGENICANCYNIHVASPRPAPVSILFRTRAE